MNKNVLDLLFLFVSIIMVQCIYAFWIDPNVATLSSENAINVDTRNFFIIVKDFEQKICFIIFLWAIAIVVKEMLYIENSSYLFEVDLFKEEDVSHKTSMGLVESLECLPGEVKNTPLVQVIGSALRRFALTGDVHSSASAIEPALDSLSMQYEGRLALIKYIAWAIPSIGFIGTVRGIGEAMSQAEAAVGGNIAPMTSSLGTAFNSTFIALLISVVLMLAISLIQRMQDDQLIKIQNYVENYIIKRIVAT